MQVTNRKVAVGSLFAIIVLSLSACTTIKDPLTLIPVSPPPQSKLSFAYVENVFGNSVSMFTISSAGLWTPTIPFTTATGSEPESLVVDPSGRYVYVPNERDNTLSMYTIDLRTGLLQPMSPFSVPTGDGPQFIAVDPKGRFVYTANTNDNSVSMFTIDGTGLLRPTNPPYVHAASQPGLGPGGIAVDPTDRFVYTSNYDGSLSMFTIDQTSGVLNQIGSGQLSCCNFPFTMAIEPTGHFAYVPDNDLNRVNIYSIDQINGSLSAASPAFVSVEEGPTSIGIDPQARFLYVVNRNSRTISQFHISLVDGSLTPMSVPTLSDPGQPWQILMDPSGQLAYVSNEGTNTVDIYSIGTDGALTHYSSAPTGQVPGGMGLAVKR